MTWILINSADFIFSVTVTMMKRSKFLSKNSCLFKQSVCVVMYAAANNPAVLSPSSFPQLHGDQVQGRHLHKKFIGYHTTETQF